MTRSRRFFSSCRLMALVVAAGAVVGASACRKADQPAAAASAPAPVEIGAENVIRVAMEDISVGPLISGELRAQREATVRAEGGGSVLAVVPEEGQSVKKGTLLARLEARTQEDALRSAQSLVRSAEEALQVAERELERTARLVKGGALADRELEGARNAAVAARAQKDDAQARLASARKALDDTVVRSPIAGIVARRHISAGDVVSPGRELYTIIDPSSMRLEASVPSEEIVAIRVGAPVTFEVRGYPGQTFSGHIERVSPMADPVTRQVPIFVDIPNVGGRLVAGLFAEGRILRDVKRTLVVPAAALNEPRAGAPWVLRVRDGKAERVDVSVGLRDSQTERVELTSGVAAGDVLLVGAAQGMTPGTPVRVREAAQQAGE